MKKKVMFSGAGKTGALSGVFARCVPRSAGSVALFAVAALLLLLVSCKEPSEPEKALSDGANLFTLTGSEDYRSPNHKEIESSNLVNQSNNLEDGWYRDSSFYHIWVKSFADSTTGPLAGDGCGDLNGITEKLDYIKNKVGCDAIWLSPIFDCASKGTAASYNMHGYDTIDYYAINPRFGTKEDLGNLLAAAHDRGMKVIFDFVPNHTSDQHPWFAQSAQRANGKDDWYLWSAEDRLWNPLGGRSAWYRNSARDSYYYGAFWAGMPDLNFRNREVREELKNVARYWLNFGFDGLRMDAVRYLVEEPNDFTDTQATHDWYAELRSEVIDAYGSDIGAAPKFMVCEAWINNDRGALDAYFGTAARAEFDMAFDFDFPGRLYYSVISGTDYVSSMDGLYASGSAPDKRYGSFLSNHDNVSSRPATFFEGDRLELYTALSLLQPTTPFIYYGNEIAQKDGSGYGSEDIRLRLSLDWNVAQSAIQAVELGAAQGLTPSGDPASILALHKALLVLRRDHAAFRTGAMTAVKAFAADTGAVADLPRGFAAYTLTDSSAGETFLCVFNLENCKKYIDLSLSLSGYSSASTLVGRPTCVSADGSSVTVSSFGPYAVRVYQLGGPADSESTSPLYNSESTGSSMYLRGSFNDWKPDIPMTYSIVENEVVWTADVELLAGTHTFKFDSSGAKTEWPDGQNWGGTDGANMSYTAATSGMYRFSFNFSRMRCDVELLEGAGV
ncbi:MAG: hypothetical protein EWM51_01680 [Treponema sp.]|nr:MAG: hypothetical protein EWM51_01680 [Treponema sp.]